LSFGCGIKSNLLSISLRSANQPCIRHAITQGSLCATDSDDLLRSK
jgi:hypothetical protein